MKFKVGDRVRSKHKGIEYIEYVVESVPGVYRYDRQGFIDAESGMVLKDYGWAFQCNWELVGSSKTNTMTQNIGPMQKRLLDADTQKLVKAGIINGDLELTSEGQKTLMAVLFEANKAALVAEAEQIIEDAKTN